MANKQTNKDPKKHFGIGQYHIFCSSIAKQNRRKISQGSILRRLVMMEISKTE